MCTVPYVPKRIEHKLYYENVWFRLKVATCFVLIRGRKKKTHEKEMKRHKSELTGRGKCR